MKAGAAHAPHEHEDAEEHEDCGRDVGDGGIGAVPVGGDEGVRLRGDEHEA